ncbi:unnamed protein product [Microthlaspi erraticum]|uniref:Uncharacterized protein n=1 Tax=Microthlaspi erraticum TaxID=1685480 RepID=A0A6D2HMF6_9BRAS|nr:unnamed protein product [Microthlaspi erraticum]
MMRRTCVVIFDQKKSVCPKEHSLACDQESSSFYSTEVDRNLLRVSRPRATTDPAIFGSKRSKRDSRLTRSNSACGLDSVELELDFVFTSSSDSKQLDLDKDTWWAREMVDESGLVRIPSGDGVSGQRLQPS